jgi:hypothetical protein
LIRHEAFDEADGHWVVYFATAAFVFAKGGAGTSADERKRISLAVNRETFFVTALGDEREVGGRVHACRAGVDAFGADEGFALAGRTELIVNVGVELIFKEL